MKRIISLLLCTAVYLSFAPAVSYADEAITAEPGVLSESFDAVDIHGDSDSWLETYMNKRISEELGNAPAKKSRRVSASSKRRNTLSESNQVIYDAIRAQAEKVAAGEEPSTAFTVDLKDAFNALSVEKTKGGTVYRYITTESLGISTAVFVKGESGWWFSDEAADKLCNVDTVLNALLTDEPYLFYWFDKGSSPGGSLSGLFIDSTGDKADLYYSESGKITFTFKMPVAASYRAGSVTDYQTDISKTKAASSAPEIAAEVIRSNGTKTDIEKLTAYKEYICEQVSYNNDVARDPSVYGDPWQMIYVFDGDDSTNVVCEGYAKAFQFLCDNTDFTSDTVVCRTVNGIMAGSGSGSGNHMWNIVCLDDGLNYMADVTNSDSGSVGQNGGLFISTAIEGGTVDGGFSFDVNNDGRSDADYHYDDVTRRLFTDAELDLASHVHKLTGIELVWNWTDKSCRAEGTCSDCGLKISEKAVVTSSVETEPTCTTTGVTTYTASFSRDVFETHTENKTKTETVTALGHDLVKVSAKAATTAAEGNIEHWKCNRCGKLFKDAAGSTEISAADTMIARIIGTPAEEMKPETPAQNKSDTSAGAPTETSAKETSPKATPAAPGSDTNPKATPAASGSDTNPKDTPAAPGSDTNQKGVDGTALGKGAPAAAAEKAITTLKNDNDPAGSAFAPLMLKSTAQTNNSIKLSWAKVKGANKYVIYGNACGKKNKFKKLATTGKTMYNVKKILKKTLRKGTYHKFMVVALDSRNNVVTTSKVIHVATKGGKAGNHKGVAVSKVVQKKAKALKKGKSLSIGAKAVAASKKLNVKKHTAIRYESSNPKIATVNKSGRITAKKKGKCKVYAYAQNGAVKVINVVVK